MKITSVHFHRLRQDLAEPLSWGAGRNCTHLGGQVIEVRTDAGLTGWGDGFSGIEPLQACPELVIGRSPFEAEAIFQEMGALTRGGVLPGGLDIAMWDLMGKALDRPVCELFGQVVRREITPYASVGYRKESQPEPLAALVEEMRHWTHDQGFRAVKMKTGYGAEQDIALVTAVRDAIGPDVKLGIDSGWPGVYDSGTAVRLGKQLELLNLEFWEEPLDEYDYEGYRRLRDVLAIPLASGEGLPLATLLEHYVQPRLVDIVQPDLDRIGLSGARKVTYAAWLNRMRIIPHTWCHTPLRIAATMHWVACIPHEHATFTNPPPVLMEWHPPNESVAVDLTEERIEIDPRTGVMPLPTGPGLGLTVIPEVLDRYRAEPTVTVR